MSNKTWQEEAMEACELRDIEIRDEDDLMDVFIDYCDPISHIENLEKEIESLKAELAKERGKNLEKANSKLSEENKILRKTLEYYEDVSIWDHDSVSEEDLRTYVPYGQEDDEVAGGRYAKDTLDFLYGVLRNY